jgi:hypothetical protein
MIDMVASLIDARSQRGSTRRLLLANAAVSAVALGVADFGYVIAAVGDDPKLNRLVLCTATGVEFVVQAWLLAQRRQLTTLPAGS